MLIRSVTIRPATLIGLEPAWLLGLLGVDIVLLAAVSVATLVGTPVLIDWTTGTPIAAEFGTVLATTVVGRAQTVAVVRAARRLSLTVSDRGNGARFEDDV